MESEENLVKLIDLVRTKYNGKKIEDARYKATGDERYAYTNEKYLESKEWGKTITKKIPGIIKNIIGDGYNTTGKYGHGKNWTDICYIPIFDVEITTNASKGFYPVFLFKPDKTGVFFSLAIGTGNFTSSSKLSPNDINTLEYLTNVFKTIFLYYYQSRNDLNFNLDNFDDVVDFNGEYNHSEEYEAGTIFAKEYTAEELSSNEISEEDLNNDIFEMMAMYNFAKEYKIFDRVLEVYDHFHPLDLAQREPNGENILLYGVPGSGKSYAIEQDYCDDDSRMERVIFHPDYTYGDFIGQILPIVSDGNVTYDFVPGPFTSILEKAFKNPNESFYLIIEELNRGNAPAIFGDVFQLLDRMESYKDGFKKGTSEYAITNSNIAYKVYDNKNHKVRIPSNLNIIATMNTSDQNVFTLDTAFQRRWKMRLIENDLDDKEFAIQILNTNKKWNEFCKGINKFIIEINSTTLSSEDKRLGAYFVRKDDLLFDNAVNDENATETQKEDAQLQNNKFAEKVLKYLWDDAFKFDRDKIFDKEEVELFTLEYFVEKFSAPKNEDRFSIFTNEARSYIGLAEKSNQEQEHDQQ
ncbi:DUF3578 domain-containing protein [Methanobrevibacter sp.]|uniref:MrcB family domain-containing protein n=1 Tax=Methanobrevibacter sp. TaxID=66852 RepID=UPI0026DF9D80|nr:DUF3578 domain-containing protein [Methanobrevibacter sp.]MDO5824268.1 DUF3578 domain-containing protein [Methanobrevibacter sp.]